MTPNIQQLADGCLQFLREGKSEYVLQIWSEFPAVLDENPLWAPRFHAWFCQAHLNLRQPKEALRHCHTGIRLAKAIDDQKGVEAIEELRSQAVAMLTALTKQSEDLDHLLSKANQAIVTQSWIEAEQFATQSLEEAILQEDTKLEVLSLLTLARIPALQQQYLARAHKRTQEINDFNLITLVKKSYDALGVSLPTHVF